MRLDKVEIVGFKSFCDKQEVDFKGGVTGIVGPNGCGKSNISDAISWVLGEQSAKSLRGTSMEDVIFGGSQSRQPLAMAEVNLRVSGLNGNSPDGSPECVVSRRLYRNGESEYLMNGQTCRLRDVHELFMDTGLGSKAYSIIEQGKIGLILSSKPADRRALIEEAAGITKYKARRRQTQLKLEATQQNLLRVNDIVHEVEKQLESLKRQAGKARRYRALREEMKGLERVLYGRRFLDLSELSSAVAARLTEEAEREQVAAVALASEEAQMEGRRGALYEEEERLSEARARLTDLTLSVDRHQGQSGYCQQQIAETETRTQDARREAAELDARVGPLGEALGTRRQDAGRLKEEVGGAEAEARGAEGAVQEAAARQAAAEREQEQAREAQIGILGRMATLQNARQAAQGTAERAGAALLKLGAEREELEREQARIGEALAAAQERECEAETLRLRLTEEREAASARAAACRAGAEALGREADAVQSERDGLAGRLASLQDMVTTHAAFDEGVRALLARPQGIEVLGVVADSVETEPECERLVEAFLGDRLQAVLVPDASQALRGVRYLEESGAGRGTFLPLASARTRNHCAQLREVVSQEPKVKGLLSDLYRVGGAHADRIRASLPDALVVDTLEDAFDVISRQGPVACATLAGESVRGTMVEGGRGVNGLLAPRREIREVAARLDQLNGRLAEARERQQAELAAAEAAAADARSLEERIHAAEKDLVAIRHAAAASQEEVTRLGRKAGVLATERRQAEDERDQAAARLVEIDAALAAAEADKARESERLAALGAAVGEARAA
ncbi:MAG TPA: chromosome segregation protein SMC, partial [Vicinamibacteria bacterium]|nr:chromosome segregation protein SMC [Vicinamibacteria bacterium]